LRKALLWGRYGRRMSASIRRNDGSWSIRYTFVDDLIASDLMVVWGARLSSGGR
jgi:hypothetical protein